MEVGGTSPRTFARAGLMVGGVLGGGFLMLLLMGGLVIGAFVLFLRWAWHS